MNLRDVMVALAGGAMVYGAMAACTGGETARGAHAGDGAAGAGACECGPPKAKVDWVDCVDGEASMYYPDISREELALVHVVPDVEVNGAVQLTHHGVLLFDGEVRAGCTPGFQVAFIRP